MAIELEDPQECGFLRVLWTQMKRRFDGSDQSSKQESSSTFESKTWPKKLLKDHGPTPRRFCLRTITSEMNSLKDIQPKCLSTGFKINLLKILTYYLGPYLNFKIWKCFTIHNKKKTADSCRMWIRTTTYKTGFQGPFYQTTIL